MKTTILTAVGICGSTIAEAFEEWDKGLITLVTFMAIDYITGLMLAGVFKKSKKSKNGGLESKVGFKGLCKKCTVLLFVLIAHRLDLMTETNYIRDAVVIGFIANEAVSITENATLMGVPLPNVIIKAIDILNKKGDNNKKI